MKGDGTGERRGRGEEKKKFLLLFFFPPLSLAYELPAWFNPHLPVLDYGVCLGERGKNDLITPLLRW